MSRRLRQLRAKVVRAQRAHRNAGPALEELQRALHAQLRREVAADRVTRDLKTRAAGAQLALDVTPPDEDS